MRGLVLLGFIVLGWIVLANFLREEADRCRRVTVDLLAAQTPCAESESDDA